MVETQSDTPDRSVEIIKNEMDWMDVVFPRCIADYLETSSTSP